MTFNWLSFPEERPFVDAGTCSKVFGEPPTSRDQTPPICRLQSSTDRVSAATSAIVKSVTLCAATFRSCEQGDCWEAHAALHILRLAKQTEVTERHVMFQCVFVVLRSLRLSPKV